MNINEAGPVASRVAIDNDEIIPGDIREPSSRSATENNGQYWKQLEHARIRNIENAVSEINRQPSGGVKTV
ncbi:hypothetical protein JTB14_002269 [Gonioctena quinquepunctata]|nr:hypothetical protein JTB14_002269 [Gonioctena quinquepunctata]